MDEHALRRDATEPSDERLFAVFQNATHDAERELALRELVRRYQDRLYAFAYRTLRHASDAEDAVQEAFARAIRYASSFSPRKSKSASPFRTWIYMMTRSTTIDIARQRHPIADIQGIGMGHDHSTDHGGGADHLVSHPVLTLNAQLDAQMQLEPALAKMSEADQVLLHLVYAEDLSLNEVAEVLGASHAAIKVRLHRARARLKAHLPSRTPLP